MCCNLLQVNRACPLLPRITGLGWRGCCGGRSKPRLTNRVGSVEYVGKVPRRLEQRGRTVGIETQGRDSVTEEQDERVWETSICDFDPGETTGDAGEVCRPCFLAYCYPYPLLRDMSSC